MVIALLKSVYCIILLYEVLKWVKNIRAVATTGRLKLGLIWKEREDTFWNNGNISHLDRLFGYTGSNFS